jgi:hypothetical protein
LPTEVPPNFSTSIILVFKAGKFTYLFIIKNTGAGRC